MNLEGPFWDFEVGVSTDAIAVISCIRPFIIISRICDIIMGLEDGLDRDHIVVLPQSQWVNQWNGFGWLAVIVSPNYPITMTSLNTDQSWPSLSRGGGCNHEAMFTNNINIPYSWFLSFFGFGSFRKGSFH